MIVGRGDIASILKDRVGAIIFASGVSNSNELLESEYDREKKLLLNQDKTKCLFYFSSIDIDNLEKFSKSRYLQHKKHIEDCIKSNFENYNIIRIGNINWGKNPNTFLNYINNKIKNKEPFEIRNEFKYIIDKESLITIVESLPLTGKNQISVFSKMAKVKDLL